MRKPCTSCGRPSNRGLCRRCAWAGRRVKDPNHVQSYASPERLERIEHYSRRAAQGLPLFS